MPLHVVFGAGQIGPHLARALAARGHEVALVRRSPMAPIDGVTGVSGDAGDAAFAKSVTRGAAAVYHCMNPPYAARVWAVELPRLMDSLIAAAGANGARLVVLDNLYMLGRPLGPMNEDTPARPASRKGAVRARVAERLFAAHARGEVRAVSGRASDFYGPAATASYFGDFFWPAALAGKRPQLPINPDTPHTYHFTRDVAQGLALLGEADDDVCGRWWMLPCAPAATTREMVRRLAAALGRPIAPRLVPGVAIAALGVFMPLMRELAEMRYQWDVPFVCDDRRFRERFKIEATPLERGIPETVAWALLRYGAVAAAAPA